MANPTVETRTKYAGVHARHSRGCSLARGGTRCSCSPSYIGRFKFDGKKHPSPAMTSAEAARNWINDERAKLEAGGGAEVARGTVAEMIAEFAKAIDDGTATN